MSKFIPASMSHPGALIREEVEGRGWALSDLATIMGRPLQVISDIVNGKRGITAITAKELGVALGTGPELWVNLQSMWELSQTEDADSKIEERVAIYNLAPVREMERRGWIKKTKTPEDLTDELAKHYGVRSLNDVPQFAAAARAAVSGERSELTPEQWAWCCRAKNVASLVHTEKYSASSLRECVKELRVLAAASEPEELRQVPRLLSEAGVRLVIVEHLKRTRMDGAALTHPGTPPIVSLSLRYGQVDKFWHTLMHEIAHIIHNDGMSADSDLSKRGANVDEVEARANTTAANWLVPPEEMASFIRRTTMAYTTRKIINFARRIGVHPAIVTGQLKFKGELQWSQFTKLHVDVRDAVRQCNVSDGWGESAL